MAWHKGRYYVRKHWEDGSCRSEYVGVGPFAEALAELDALDRARREAERAAWRREQEQIEAMDAQVDAVCALIRAVADGCLLIDGYHTHKGQWRRRRE